MSTLRYKFNTSICANIHVMWFELDQYLVDRQTIEIPR